MPVDVVRISGVRRHQRTGRQRGCGRHRQHGLARKKGADAGSNGPTGPLVHAALLSSPLD